MLAFHNKQSVKDKYCRYCLKPLLCKRFISGLKESPSALSRRQFCNQICVGKFKTAKVVNPSWNFAHKQARKLKQDSPCERCGFIETDTEDNRAFHSAPNHEVRVSEEYLGDGEYKKVTIASTGSLKSDER